LKKKLSFWRAFQKLRRQMKPTKRRRRMTKCAMASIRESLGSKWVVSLLIYACVHWRINYKTGQLESVEEKEKKRKKENIGTALIRRSQNIELGHFTTISAYQ
jgi:hypothetical protein